MWEVVRRTPLTHPQTPLWYNPCLKELLQLPDRNLWITKGVVYLADLFCGIILKSFQQLKDDFDLPNSMHFRYLLLHHAIQTQFRDTHPNLEQLDILNVISGPTPKTNLNILQLSPPSNRYSSRLSTKR